MPSLWENKVLYDTGNASYWTSETWAPDAELTALPADDIEGSMVSLIFGRTVATSIREDEAQFSLRLAVEAGPGASVLPLTASQAGSAEAILTGTLWAGIRTHLATDWVLKEYVWRNWGAAYPLDENGISKPGPIWRVTAVGTAGTNSSYRMPDQVAATVTFRTASREHWGRVYVGGFPVTATGPGRYGHLTTTVCDEIAQAFADTFSDLQDEAAIVNPWIYSTAHRGVMSINEVVMDDVFDVIRSRRAKEATYRKRITS